MTLLIGNDIRMFALVMTWLSATFFIKDLEIKGPTSWTFISIEIERKD